MSVDYSILTSAIADVGYWRWWAENLPGSFQIEFGGVQIYSPPEDKTKPPSSLLALRFIRPSHISFIRKSSDLEDLPVDWAEQLRDDKIDSFTISHEELAICDDALFGTIIRQVQGEITHFTDDLGGKDLKFAFWAGDAGLRIEAAEVRLFLMSGEIDLPKFTQLNRDWWSYWREYWKKRDTPDAFPKDFACEVTIPIDSD